MLELLHIENIAIIERADILFGRGFNALTGETGAGKSIVIDALGAVLGQRTSRELIRTGAPNVVCTQPFACLPNHVVGKAVIKELRRRYPESNIVAVDYDPGASEVNQLNRIKLMIAVAKSNLADKEAEARAARTAAATPAAEEAGKLDVQETRA